MRTLLSAVWLCAVVCNTCTADFWVSWRSTNGINDPAKPGAAPDLQPGSLVQSIWTPSGVIAPVNGLDPTMPQGDNVLVAARYTDTSGSYYWMDGPFPDGLRIGYVFTRIFNTGSPELWDYYGESGLRDLTAPGPILVCDAAATGLFTLDQRLRPPCFIDIKANGSDGPVYLGCCQAIDLTIEVAPCGLAGIAADWWIVMAVPPSHPLGLWHYELLDPPPADPNDYWWPGLIVTHQGPVFDMSRTSLGLLDELPPGYYTFYFGVDLRMNGIVDFDVLYLDTVDVILQF